MYQTSFRTFMMSTMDNLFDSQPSQDDTPSTSGEIEDQPIATQCNLENQSGDSHMREDDDEEDVKEKVEDDNEEVHDDNEEVEDDNEEVEECSVCKNEVIDTTVLSDCIHEFCYDCIIGWLTKGSGPFCPMCKAPVKFIKRKGTNVELTIQQIKSEQEPEATAAENLLTEKRMVSRKIRGCRRLMNRLDEIIGVSGNRIDAQKRKPRLEELNQMKRLCVSQLNSLLVLREDIDHGAVKALIVSRVEFRKLIYERQTVAEGLPEQTRPVSKKEFLANIEHYRTVLNAFLTVEMKSLPAKKQPSVDHENIWYFDTLSDQADGQIEEMIQTIFGLISDRGVEGLNSKDVDEALSGLVPCRAIVAFITEIKSLVNSRKTFLEWCGSVTYRNKSDRVGENRNTEVVTVDDNIEEVEPSRYGRHDTLRPRRHPLYIPYEAVFNQASHSGRNFSNVGLPSLLDIFEAPLRLGPTGSNPFRPAPPHPLFPSIPTAGISWRDLTSSANPKNVPLVSLDEDDEEERENSTRSDGEIQVVDQDGTIVLDDTLDTPAGKANNEISSRKRKFDFSSPDQWKKAKADSLPIGLVQDVEKLVAKYNLPMLQAVNIMANATQVAIMPSSASNPVNLLASPPNSNEPSTSSNLKPDDALQLAGSSDLARNGLAAWTKNAPTQSTRRDH